MHAYVLIEAKVVSVDTVTGPFDVIALLEAADLDQVGQAVAEAIQRIEGVGLAEAARELGIRLEHPRSRESAGFDAEGAGGAILCSLASAFHTRDVFGLPESTGYDRG